METAASILYVGLDVHKESIDIAPADEGRDGEVRHIGRIGGDLVALDKAQRRLISHGHRLHVVYEAGPCGFVVTKRDDPVSRWLVQLTARVGWQKACVAMANKNARILCAVMTREQGFDPRRVSVKPPAKLSSAPPAAASCPA